MGVKVELITDPENSSRIMGDDPDAPERSTDESSCL